MTPTRGATLCTFRQTARILAGVDIGAPDSSTAGAATLAGLCVARERGMS